MIKMFKILFVLCLLAGSAKAQKVAIPKWKLADMQQVIDTSTGPIVLNFWATFCVPCLKEMPYFQKAADQNPEIKLYFISLDVADAYPKKINDFTVKRGIKAPVAFLDETDADLFCPVVDKSWSGAIPATLFLNNKTGYRHFIEDELTPEQLEEEIQKMLAPKS